MSTSDASAQLAVSRGGDTRRAAHGSDDGGEVSRAPLADSLGPRLGPAATFATTEHFNLQTARALTVSEANGRASIYLAALSGNLIALGLRRTDVPAWRGVLCVRADSVAGVGFRGGRDLPASGSGLDRGHRICESHRAPAQLLPGGHAGAQAVPRRCLRNTVRCAV